MTLEEARKTPYYMQIVIALAGNSSVVVYIDGLSLDGIDANTRRILEQADSIILKVIPKQIEEIIKTND